MHTVDMGSVTETLFESELFGHVKGAFTHAVTDRQGKFEAAEGSTLFMDEIGNLPPHLQSKLLVTLQNREVVRVGSNKPVKVDIRLICATNRNLDAMTGDGRFREDLLYRINTIHLQLPPLRERREDIVPLARIFMARFARQYDRPVTETGGVAKQTTTQPDRGEPCPAFPVRAFARTGDAFIRLCSGWRPCHRAWAN